MNRRLGGWAQAVKHRYGRTGALPPLWLVTDAARMPQLDRIAGGLPPRLAGIILREDAPSGDARARAAKVVALAQLCRRRHLALSIAGSIDVPARYGAGRHLRRGRRLRGRGAFVTSSAHDVTELIRARRTGAVLILLSPVFATATHPGAIPLGVQRWASLAGRDRSRIAALGGVNGATVRRLPQWCRHIAGISGLIDCQPV